MFLLGIHSEQMGRRSPESERLIILVRPFDICGYLIEPRMAVDVYGILIHKADIKITITVRELVLRPGPTKFGYLQRQFQLQFCHS